MEPRPLILRSAFAIEFSLTICHILSQYFAVRGESSKISPFSAILPL
jgi:hypothetical protein